MSRPSLYLVLYSLLFLPGYAIWVLNIDLLNKYVDGSSGLNTILFHLLCIVSLATLARLSLIKSNGTQDSKSSHYPSQRIRATNQRVSLEKRAIYLYLILSLLVPYLGLNDYRHTMRLFDVLIVILPLEVLRTVIIGIIVVKSCDSYAYKNTKNNYFSYFIFVVATVIGSTGSFVIIQVAVIVLLTYLIKERIKFLKMSLMLSLSGIVSGVAILIGFANKYAFDVAVLSDLFIENFDYVQSYLLWRVSTMAHSMSIWLENSEIINHFTIIWQETQFRISKIFGASVSEPDVRSIARLNYLNIFQDTSHPRSGTSPGLFGTLASTLPYNLGSLLIALIITTSLLKLFFFIRLCFFRILPMCLMMVATYAFLDSVMDLLIIPGLQLIKLFILYLLFITQELR